MKLLSFETIAHQLSSRIATATRPSGRPPTSTFWRTLLRQALRVCMIIASALTLWNLAKVVTASPSPLVVVLSESMSPAIHKGDVLLLTNTFPSHQVGVGDIVVFNIDGKGIPIVHRVIQKFPQPSSSAKDGVSHASGAARANVVDPTIAFQENHDDWSFLTKGDRNLVDDRGLYAEGQNWITRADIQGKVVGVLRYVGFATILLNEYPAVKYALLGIMGWTAFTSSGDE